MSAISKLLRVAALVIPVTTAFMYSATKIANEYEVIADGIFGVDKVPIETKNSSSSEIPSSKEEQVSSSESEASSEIKEPEYEIVDLYEKKFETNDEYVNYREDVMRRIVEEGSSLLKNKNNTLPLSGEGKKISLFGTASHYPLLGGNISAFVQTDASKTETIESSLREFYTLNPELISFYTSKGNKRSASPGSSFNTGEVALTNDVRSSYSSYNDAAICVVARANAEENDYFPNGTVTDTSNDNTNKGLSLSKLEKDMIEEAASNFNKVILVINSVVPLEINQYKNDDRIGAILWVGFPGSTGFKGVARLIHGDANPSGSTVDTFAVSQSNSPAAQNFSAYTYSNASSMLRGDYSGFANYGSSYLVQAEGIYVGYKYYETRYYDSINDPTGSKAKSTVGSLSGAWDYSKEVVYPFGYGLSYTTFDEEFVDKDGENNPDIIIDEKGKATTYVKVTNTGEVNGKHAVKMFYQSPYTANNKRDGVEKSAASLISYAKTKELVKGESEIVKLTFDAQYLASYNSKIVYNGLKGAYTLDVGDYYFAIGNGSHEAVNNILVKQGKGSADGVDYVDANADKKVIKKSLGTDSGDGYDYTYTISKNGTRISNHFEDADYNYFKPNTITYLTRSNWETFPQTYNSGFQITNDMMPYLTNSRYTLKTNESTSDFTWGATKTIDIREMYGKDFDDPAWQTLISQLSLEDAIGLANKYNGGLDLTASVGLSGWKVLDGPIGMMTSIQTETLGTYSLSSMPCEPLVAATFNHELQLEEGECFGQDSLLDTYDTFFAPGMNVHRTPFCGRNHEYYSEDSMLCNYVGVNVTTGTRKYGCVTVLKHFCFNDIEAKRQGICEFMCEQGVRENELRAYQGPCENNTAHGVMASYSRVGLKPGCANENISVDVLRKEWGFKGILITDAAYKMYTPYLDWVDSLAHGGAQMLATSAIWATKTVASQIQKDHTLMSNLYDVCHYHLYTYLYSNKFNFKIQRLIPSPDDIPDESGEGDSSENPDNPPDIIIIPDDEPQYITVRRWKTNLNVSNGILTGLSVIAIAGYIVFEIFERKKRV